MIEKSRRGVDGEGTKVSWGHHSRLAKEIRNRKGKEESMRVLESLLAEDSDAKTWQETKRERAINYIEVQVSKQLAKGSRRQRSYDHLRAWARARSGIEQSLLTRRETNNKEKTTAQWRGSTRLARATSLYIPSARMDRVPEPIANKSNESGIVSCSKYNAYTIKYRIYLAKDHI